MLHLVKEPIASPRLELPQILIRAERLQLAKRLWRGTAEDGTEFGFELQTPLKPDQTVFETSEKRYIISQAPEAVLEIALDVPASAAAGIGWAVGNLHLELCAEATRLLTPDDPAARQLFERIGISFKVTQAIFRPGRFVRGEKSVTTSQDLGPSHRH